MTTKLLLHCAFRHAQVRGTSGVFWMIYKTPLMGQQHIKAFIKILVCHLVGPFIVLVPKVLAIDEYMPH